MFLFIHILLSILYLFISTSFINYHSNSIFGIILIILMVILSIAIAFLTIALFLRIFVLTRKYKPHYNMVNHKVANQILKYVMTLLRSKAKVLGLENVPKDYNFVLVGNHQENWEIFFIKTTLYNYPVSFIAKETLFKLPLIGPWLRTLGNVSISRFADREAAKAMIEGVKRVKGGQPMAIFPEGKRTFGNKMIDFKPGAFRLAIKAKADILPVVSYDMSNVLNKWPFKKQIVTLSYLPIIKYEDFKDMKTSELSDKVHSMLQDELNRLDNLKK